MLSHEHKAKAARTELLACSLLYLEKRLFWPWIWSGLHGGVTKWTSVFRACVNLLPQTNLQPLIRLPLIDAYMTVLTAVAASALYP